MNRCPVKSSEIRSSAPALKSSAGKLGISLLSCGNSVTTGDRGFQIGADARRARDLARRCILMERRQAPRRCLAPCALAAPRALRFDGASRLAPRQRLALCGSTAPRASRLDGASRFGGATCLAPRRRLVPRASAAPCASRLGGATRIAARWLLTFHGSTAPRASRQDGALRLLCRASSCLSSPTRIFGSLLADRIRTVRVATNNGALRRDGRQ